MGGDGRASTWRDDQPFDRRFPRSFPAHSSIFGHSFPPHPVILLCCSPYCALPPQTVILSQSRHQPPPPLPFSPSSLFVCCRKKKSKDVVVCLPLPNNGVMKVPVSSLSGEGGAPAEGYKYLVVREQEQSLAWEATTRVLSEGNAWLSKLRGAQSS